MRDLMMSVLAVVVALAGLWATQMCERTRTEAAASATLVVAAK